MSITKITDHADRHARRFVQQFKEKPNLDAIIRAIGDEAQAVEDAAWDVFTKWGIDDAEGAQLDVTGKMLGQPRTVSLADDVSYRLQLKARIRVLRSSGTVEDLYSVFQGIWMDTGGTMKIEQTDNAKQTITFGGKGMDAATAILFQSFLKEAKASGVGTYMLWQTADDADMLELDDANDLGSVGGTGLGDAGSLVDPDGGSTTGGQLAGVAFF